MKVAELINRLQKCNPDCEVYFEETQTQNDDGIIVGVYSIVDCVCEVGVREKSDGQWNVERVVLSNE